METVTRDVKEIAAADRQALEHVLGTQLCENDRVVIQVLSADGAKTVEPPEGRQNSEPGALPAWCNVYQGLSDDEIDDIERSIVRSGGSRSFH